MGAQTESLSFIQRIKEEIPESNWAEVIPALRQDGFLWYQLQDGELLNKSSNMGGYLYQKWSPASFALTSLDNPVSLEYLKDPTLMAVEGLIAKTARNAFNDFKAVLSTPSSLSEAALVALNLREEYSETGNWDFLLKVMDETGEEIWQTALNILYGMLPNNELGFVQMLSGSATSISRRHLAINIILSNPADIDTQTNILANLINQSVSATRFEDLNYILDQRPVVGKQLVERFLRSDQKGISSSQNPLDEMIGLIQKAALLKTEKNYSDALESLEASEKAFHRYMQESYGSLALSSFLNNESDTSRKVSQKILEKTNLTGAKSLSSKLVSLDTSNSTSIIDTNSAENLGELILLSVSAYRENDISKAVDVVEIIIELLREDKENYQVFLSLGEGEDVLYFFMDLLSELGLWDQIIEISEEILKQKPNSSTLLKIAGHAYSKIGDMVSALAKIESLITVTPYDTATRRDLGKIYLKNEDFEKALPEFERVILANDTVSARDLLNAAEAALAMNFPERSTQYCQQVIKSGNSSALEIGTALLISGKSLAYLGNLEMAIENFSKAIKHIPEEPECWLVLAKTHLIKGETGKGIHILEEATEKIVDSPTLLFTLGKAYLDSGENKAAVLTLEKSLMHAPEQDQNFQGDVFLALSKALIKLGKSEEIIDKYYALSENNKIVPEIQQVYANALYLEGENNQAAAIAEKVISKGIRNAGLFNLAALAKLQSDENPEVIRDFLIQAENIEPDNMESIFVHAELQKRAGNYKNAIDSYQKAMESALGQDTRFRKQICTGIGESALALDNPDLAIGSLQEVLYLDKDNLGVKQLLAEAYNASGLKDKAEILIDEIVREFPEDPDNLVWTAFQYQMLGKEEKTGKTLQSAYELHPQNPEVVTALGKFYFETGKEEQAVSLFEKSLHSKRENPEILFRIGKFLQKQGASAQSLPYFEKAVQISGNTDLDMIKSLVNIQLKLGKNEAAMNSIDLALSISPEDTGLMKEKGLYLLRTNQPKTAIQYFEKSLGIVEDDLEVKAALAEAKRETGDLKGALEIVNQISESGTSSQTVSLISVEIERACLHFKRAFDLLNSIDQVNDLDGQIRLMKADTAIELGLAEQSFELVKEVVSSGSENAYGQAVLATMLGMRGELSVSSTWLNKALKTISRAGFTDLQDYQINNILAITTKAAILNRQWNLANRLVNQIIEKTPLEPRGHALQALIALEKAFFIDQCDVVGIKGYGFTATFEDLKDTYSRSIQTALRCAPDEEGIAALMQLRNSGDEFFGIRNTADYIFPGTNETMTRHLAALRLKGELETIYNLEQSLDLLNPGILFQLAVSFEGKNLNHAFSLIEKAVGLHKENGIYLALAGKIGIATGQIKNGLAYINQAIEIFPEETGLLEIQAIANLAEKNYGEAIISLEKAIRFDGMNPSHYLSLGKAYLKDDAPGNAIRVFENGLKVDKNNLDIWSGLTKAYLACDNPEKADRCAQEAIKIAPMKAEPYLLRAKVASQVNDLDTARKYANKAVEQNPGNLDAILQVSEIYKLQNQSHEAIAFLENHIGTIDEQLPLLIEKANLKKGVFGQEIYLEELNQIAENYPGDCDVQLLLSNAYVEAGDMDSAINTARTALKSLKENYGKLEKAAYHLHLGSLLNQTGQLDLALTELTNAAAENPEMKEIYLETAEVHRKRRDLDAAIQQLEKAAALTPEDVSVIVEIGIAYRDKRDFVNAEKAIRKAAKLQPKDVNIQQLLGAITTLKIAHAPEEVLV
ncbi:MAG: tetratricopeptide repeat protein [Anaerolineales bacterium]|nr:tetratricopeptide repeat protein [Anaerolineales bacterium]